MRTFSKPKKPLPVKALILGIPAVSIYIQRNSYDPFNTPKLIILLMLSGWLFSHLISNFRDSGSPKTFSEILQLSLPLVFIISLFVVTLLTDVKIIGFLGDTQRRNGFLQYFCLVIILIYASRAINPVNAIYIYKSSIVTGLVLSLYGVLQITGRDFIKWNNPYNSMISTLGNPNFASALLAILAAMSFYALFLVQISPLYKFLGVVNIFFSILAITKSDSRQGLITLLFSILVYFSIFLFIKHRKIGIFFSIISLLVSLSLVLAMLQKGPFVSLIYKDSISVRGFYWRAGINMLKENFVSGVGVDRYGANFKFYREAAYPLRYGFDITSSNAHNTPIQIFSTAGVITGLFYLALLATILVLGLRGLLKLEKNAQLVLLGLISSWVGFQAQSFISIDNVGISVWGWLLGGCILGISNSDNFKQAINESSKKRVNKVDINLLQPIVAVIVLLPITYLSYNLLQAEQDTFNTKNYTNPNAPQNKTPVLEYAYQVINNKYADPYYKFIVALSMYEMGNKNEALFEITKLLKNDPKNLTFLNALALLKPVDSELTMILELREQILKYDPWNANNYLELCKLYKLSQNKNGVEQMVNQINQFIPNSSIAVEAQKILASFE